MAGLLIDHMMLAWTSVFGGSGPGDHVCSDHFTSGRKSDNPFEPDYIPSVKLGYDETPKAVRDRQRSLARFKRSEARLVAAAEREMNENEARRKIEQSCHLVKLDHSYCQPRQENEGQKPSTTNCRPEKQSSGVGQTITEKMVLSRIPAEVCKYF